MQRRSRSAATSKAKTVSWPLTVELPREQPQHDVLAKVWARQKIEDLMQQTYYQGSPAVEEMVTAHRARLQADEPVHELRGGRCSKRGRPVSRAGHAAAADARARAAAGRNAVGRLLRRRGRVRRVRFFRCRRSEGEEKRAEETKRQCDFRARPWLLEFRRGRDRSIQLARRSSHGTARRRRVRRYRLWKRWGTAGTWPFSPANSQPEPPDLEPLTLH